MTGVPTLCLSSVAVGQVLFELSIKIIRGQTHSTLDSNSNLPA